MPKNMRQYRMAVLMSYEEIEANAMLTKLGSRNAYCNALSHFTQEVPRLLAALLAPTKQEEVSAFLDSLSTIQDMLLSIGGTALLWKAEKLSQAATTKPKFELLTLETGRLKTEVMALCKQIEKAEVEPNDFEGTESSPNTEHSTQSMNPALFEKLYRLIENFEADEAIIAINKLMQSSYSAEIDTMLASIRTYLHRYDYAKSSAEANDLMRMIYSMQKPSESNAKKKILAVDDIPDVLNTIKSVLKNEYAVYGVTNHTAALKYLTHNTADLILLDIEMPDVNGFTLLGIIRKMEACKNTPVLFLTASASMENVKKSVLEGGNGFIKKPINAEFLLEKIRSHLRT